MTTLHVIRGPNERLALEIAGHQSKRESVSLLLIQDAVLSRPALDGATIYALSDDLEARGVKGRGVAVDYDGVIRLIAEHDRVIVW
jgi:sulfur relay protein TusB/DsrH